MQEKLPLMYVPLRMRGRGGATLYLLVPDGAIKHAMWRGIPQDPIEVG